MFKKQSKNFYKNLNLEFICDCSSMRIVEDFEENGSRQGNTLKIWSYLKKNFSHLFDGLSDVSLKTWVESYNPYAQYTRIRSDKKFLYVTNSGIEYMFKIHN